MRGVQRTMCLFAIFATSISMLWAQETNEKFSLTTQMFLNEMSEQASEPARNTFSTQKPDLAPGTMKLKPRRMIASPDTIGGVAYISCFIHLKDVSDLSPVQSLGVDVQETFDGLDFVTANVPVDKLNELADIDNVSFIKVAQLMRPTTDTSRQKTNTDDVLTHSADAINAGLPSMFDGTGVVLGIIDTGIDFQHIAFKDKNGNSRIKRAYVYNGSSAQEYTSITSSSPTTDDQYEDHGTHTASTAGGSSVKVSGSTVTVTDDHANATYGGMAPGADLYLAGINGLSDTYLTNALKKMVQYADGQNKPLVVSNSWGSGWGPRDGTGTLATLVGQYFGNNHPNHIILFASSNDAGRGTEGQGGGFFVKKTSASSSSPLGTIIRTEGNKGDYYIGLMACAWASSRLACKIHVLNNSGAIQKTWEVSSSTSSFSGLSTYYSGSMTVYVESENGKYRVAVATSSNNPLSSRSSGNYSLAIEVYPSSGSSHVDMWAGDYTYFTGHLTTSGHTWTAGTDDMSVSDEATIPNAISVGAYVSKTQVKNYQSNTYSYSSGTMGDIANFSSYATAEQSLTGEAYPWITAPGAQVVSGVNHYHTASVDNYSYFSTSNRPSLVVNNTSNPYGVMQGTSMATPVAAGIVALWLQAAKSVNKNLTVNDVKDIMEQTAIRDNYVTTGANASHFGKGKIDALAGIQYILGTSSIIASPTSIEFTGKYPADASQARIISVSGSNIQDAIAVTLNDASGSFSVNSTSIPKATAEAGTTISVTWTPTAVGTQTATLVLSSDNADDVTITLTGTATDATIADTYLYEGLSKSTATADGTSAISTSDENLDYSGWNTLTRVFVGSTSNAYENGGCLKLGSSSGTGTMKTGNISITGNAILSFYLKKYGSDTGNLKVTVTGATADVTTFTPTQDWTRCVVCLTKTATGPVTVQLGTTSKRAYVDEIMLTDVPTLTIANNADNFDAINTAASNGGRYNVQLKDRTLYKDGYWNTICLPFNLPIAGSLLEGADARELSSARVEDGTLIVDFTSPGVITDIVAGVPYIIKWASGDNIVNPTFGYVSIDSELRDFINTEGDVQFKGTYDLITFDAVNKSILFMGSTNTLYYPGTSALIGACRAYYQLGNGHQVRKFALSFNGDSPTAIENVKFLIPDDTEDWYDLNGIKLPGKPVRKGIYINNGKKVILK